MSTLIYLLKLPQVREVGDQGGQFGHQRGVCGGRPKGRKGSGPIQPIRARLSLFSVFISL